jgi:hypothetical protein
LVRARSITWAAQRSALLDDVFVISQASTGEEQLLQLACSQGFIQLQERDIGQEQQKHEQPLGKNQNGPAQTM